MLQGTIKTQKLYLCTFKYQTVFMKNELKVEGRFTYLELGPDEGDVLVLLHGLLGALSNFEGIIEHFKKEYKVVVPMLPILELPIKEVSVAALVEYVTEFVEFKGYEKVNVLGNSLGGHISLLYVLENPEKINSVILTGSSGLFESAFGTGFPQRGNYEYIKKKTEDTFYSPEIATKELVDEVFDAVSDRNKAIRIVKTAKSAVRHNLSDRLHAITAPTLLIWGENDNVTPPVVAERFKELISNSELHWVAKCGHAPMMEHPKQFNGILEGFLKGLRAES